MRAIRCYTNTNAYSYGHSYTNRYAENYSAAKAASDPTSSPDPALKRVKIIAASP